MYCNKCGSMLREDATFCPNCGTPCAAAGQNAAAVPTAPMAPMAPAAPVKSKSSAKIIIAAVSVVAVLAIVLTLSTLFKKDSSAPIGSAGEGSAAGNASGYATGSGKGSDSGQSAAVQTPSEKLVYPTPTFTDAPGSDFYFGETNRFSKYKGRWEIEGYHGNGGYIRVPTTYDGDGIFGEKNVTVIGKYAFSNVAVKGVCIPDGYVYLEQYSFYGCPQLETVAFEGAVQEIYMAFKDCAALKYVILPNGITKMGSNTFTNCTALEYVELPETVQTIEDFAISNCGDNVKIYIPASVTSISESAFSDNVTIIAPKGSYAAQFDAARRERIESKKHTTTAAYTPTSNSQMTYPDYSTTKLPCPTCNGSGEVLCRICGGDGVVVERTRGTGSNSWTQTVRCTYCRNGMMQCPTCFGTGTMR